MSRSSWIVAVVQRGDWLTVLRANGDRQPTRDEATVDRIVGREGLAVAWDQPRHTADGRTSWPVREAVPA